VAGLEQLLDVLFGLLFVDVEEPGGECADETLVDEELVVHLAGAQ